MTNISISEVATPKPVPYMRQLCKHFGHKVPVDLGERSGQIRFEFGVCDLRAEDARLTLTAGAASSEALSRLEHVIGGHLERFGRRDGLVVSWSRSAAGK